ncbi:hypothetical protein LWC34_13000 [Kibdelosporangium philippinense]|uniref:Bulb-type lectin domain-containing protein n=1 Tax=Kibdelosporangium philippinense TaxID=211113 RepID=A0ABS8Z894_9PSEU|nr:hypothetical protein [Kibdelosporangium philippinense]MCE7003737.1 hypothetical protein [Kibdelosporangium philippinense]
MYRSMVVTATLAASMVFALPAQAATGPQMCNWTVENIKPPEGHAPENVQVTGTDSHGNYSGNVYRPSTNSSTIVVWTNGEPRLPSEFATFSRASVDDENSSGTILLTGGDGDKWGVFRYTGGHTGNGTVTYLQPPEGYETLYGIAINDAGDVLAAAERTKDRHRVTVLWSMIAARPIVIDTPVGQGIDLDNDGTVLLYDGNNSPAHLWRAGQITSLFGRGSFVFGAIRAGKVVGTLSLPSWPDAQSVMWTNPMEEPHLIDQGGTARAINSNGLIVGDRDTHIGQSAVWRDTTFLGELPMPDRVEDASGVFVIGDDDVIYGHARDHGPLKWTCQSR